MATAPVLYGVYYHASREAAPELCEVDGGVCYEAFSTLARAEKRAKALNIETAGHSSGESYYAANPIKEGQRCYIRRDRERGVIVTAGAYRTHPRAMVAYYLNVAGANRRRLASKDRFALYQNRDGAVYARIRSDLDLSRRWRDHGTPAGRASRLYPAKCEHGIRVDDAVPCAVCRESAVQASREAEPLRLTPSELRTIDAALAVAASVAEDDAKNALATGEAWSKASARHSADTARACQKLADRIGRHNAKERAAGGEVYAPTVRVFSDDDRAAIVNALTAAATRWREWSEEFALPEVAERYREQAKAADGYAVILAGVDAVRFG